MIGSAEQDWKDETKPMTVDDFVTEISGVLRFIGDGYYHNKFGQMGYWARYRNSIRYYSYSVSGIEVRLAPDEVALAISAPERLIQREYPYINRKGVLGFEATVLSIGHAFMLSATPCRVTDSSGSEQT